VAVMAPVATVASRPARTRRASAALVNMVMVQLPAADG
jgi:hypothetical protein